MEDERIKLLIVDDELLIRSGLKILMTSYEDIVVVGEAGNGEEAVQFCQKQPVDVVLMDIRMPEVNGIDGTKQIKELDNTIKVLILTTFKDSEYIADAMSYGASGYLLKDSSHEDIYEGIRMAMRGNLVLDGQLGKQFAQNTQTQTAPGEEKVATAFQPDDYQLTDKELQIIQLVASGMTNQEIADTMFLSIGTIKNNVSVILEKLMLRDRTQLAIFAYEHGIK